MYYSTTVLQIARDISNLERSECGLATCDGVCDRHLHIIIFAKLLSISYCILFAVLMHLFFYIFFSCVTMYSRYVTFLIYNLRYIGTLVLLPARRCFNVGIGCFRQEKRDYENTFHLGVPTCTYRSVFVSLDGSLLFAVQ